MAKNGVACGMTMTVDDYCGAGVILMALLL
jgi:hypothetical protein